MEFTSSFSAPRLGWLKYFMAALGMGVAAGQETLLDYWFIYSEDMPPVEPPKVVRVIGEKGEKVEPVYANAAESPEVLEARRKRELILRTEAVQLARDLIADGKQPDVAYEEAWVRVYRRHMQRKDLQRDGSELEALLERLATEGASVELSEEELNQILHMLLADEDRLDTEEGRRLLDHIAARLRAIGYGSGKVARNDGLMALFYDGMQHGMHSYAAYRDALFKTYRDSIVHHDLVGYRAPWGAGLGGSVRYWQAPLRPGRTLASGTVLLPGKSAGSGNKKNPFLATAPPASTDRPDEENPQETARESYADEEELAPVPGAWMPEAGSSGSGSASMGAYVAVPRAVAAVQPDLTVTNRAALYFNSDGLTANGPTVIRRTSGWFGSGNTYSLDATGSYNDASWGTLSNTGTTDYWHVSGTSVSWEQKGSIFNRYYLATLSNGSVSKKLNAIQLDGGNELYMGGSDYKGTLLVNASSEAAYLGSYSPAGVVYGMGSLSGTGTLRFMAHGSSKHASIYSFNDAGASSSDWFSGTVEFGASQGGIIELDLGLAGATPAWQNVVFDLTPQAGPGHETTAGDTASGVILNIRDHVTIGGLEGGSAPSTEGGLEGDSAFSTVTSESGDAFYTLTMGVADAGQDFIYSGTFNGDYYTTATVSQSSSAGLALVKVGANQQTYTQDVTKDSNRLRSVDVQGGELRFDGDGAYDDNSYTKSLTVRFASVSGSGKLLAKNLTVHGELTDTPAFNVTGGEVHVNESIVVSTNLTTPHDLTAAGSMGVSGDARVTTTNLLVNKHLDVTGANTRVDVSGQLETGSVAVSTGAELHAGDVKVVNWLEIGQESYVPGASLVEHPFLESSGELTAGELRLRSNGVLVTTGGAQITSSSYIHGGAVWMMEGSNNKLHNSLVLEDLNVGTFSLQDEDASVRRDAEYPNTIPSDCPVLTLPKYVNVADNGWGNASQPLFDLSGVALDFCEDVIISGLSFNLAEGSVITLASTSAEQGGWFLDSSYTDTSVASVRFNQGGYVWHGQLGYDEAGNIIATILHKTEQPFTMNDGDVTYIEMRQDATAPALPHLAYTDGSYSSSTGWSGTEVPSSELLKFGNVQMNGGAHLYMGEDVTLEFDENDPTKLLVDHRGHRNFGGRITVVAGEEPAFLHGQMNNWGKWSLYGHLGGGGELKLVSHNNAAENSSSTTGPTSSSSTDENGVTTTTSTTVTTTVHGVASVFSFSSVTDPDDWFDGTLSLDDVNGGIVQLNVGNENIAGAGDTRWKDTLIDLTHQQVYDPATKETITNSDATLVLAIEGNTSIRGINGDNSKTYVVAAQPAGSTQAPFVLTVGEDAAGSHYDFAGTVGSGLYFQGGEASTVVTTVQTTRSENNTTTTLPEVTTTVDKNAYTTSTSALSLVKVGANTQEFSGSVYLNQVQVQEGQLSLSGKAVAGRISVSDGATLLTNELYVDTMTLQGGATWLLPAGTLTEAGKEASYGVVFYVEDVFRDDGAHHITLGSGTSGSTAEWQVSQNIGIVGTGSWSEDAGPIFQLNNVKPLLNTPHVVDGLRGITGGAVIEVFSGATGSFTFQENMVMVSDGNGHFYDAVYEYNPTTQIISLRLSDEATNYGIVVTEQEEEIYKDLKGYIWSGENNGHTANDVHYINMVMGEVWRADGSAFNTGWHEQRAEDSAMTDIGVYENGHDVYFLDTNVHGESESHRRVDISGEVAPGHIYVMADENPGYVSSSDQAQMEYAYAFVSTDGTGCITDFGETPTSITKTGNGLLVLNLRNTFTGGIDVQDGGLYLASVGAAGTGRLTFHTDERWYQHVVNTDNVLDYEQWRTGAELMVCYAFDTNALSAFRGSALGNDIVLTSSDPDQGGRFTVSFAYAGYNVDASGGDHANLPRHWRNLTLSGALVGTGDRRDVLALTGYSSTWKSGDDQSYVTVLTLNEDTAGDAYERNDAGQIINRFNGTVVLENTINTSPLVSNKLDARTAGSVQVVLKGDKLIDATLDMTRESVLSPFDNGYDRDGDKVADLRQTYNNILVLNGDATVRGLNAAFQGSGWDYPESDTISNSYHADYVFEDKLPQNDEVWHVRVLTSGENTLRLGSYGDTANTGTYVYSGAMGFGQSYVGTSQGHIPWGDGFFNHTNSSWKYGGHEMGTETLSLIKSSASKQYIHTALLNDVSVYEGKLGFNSLQLKGNMNLVGGSNLALGVTEGDTDWTEITSRSSSVMATSKVDGGAYAKVLTSEDVTLNAGKTLTVITLGTTTHPDTKETVPTTAVVDGNVIMAEGSALTFRTNDILPYSIQAKTYDTAGIETGIVKTAGHEDSIRPLLDINGTLTLMDAENMALTLTGTNFSMDVFSNKKYYLAEADSILIYNDTNSRYENETSFIPRTISLGYGYFGTLYTVGTEGSSLGDGDSASRDYLVMSITGDPRRTWSGHVAQIAADADETRDAHVWFTTTTAPTKTQYDYRWKENKAFQEGLVVLFGNLYEPVSWSATSELESDQTVLVKEDVLHDGTTVRDRGNGLATAYDEYDFQIDRNSLEAFTSEEVAEAAGKGYNLEYQAVRVEGLVAPFSLIINSEYYKHGADASGNYVVQIENEDGGLLHVDDTNYYFYAAGDPILDAKGNVISETAGSITDAVSVPEGLATDTKWKTMLHKSGTGTTVMALDNSYSGGSILQGGRLVMQHRNALGTGTVTLMNGALLQGDFLDENVSDSGNNYLGKAMDTTTIHNQVVVNVYADPDDSYRSIIDGRLANSYDKKLVLTTLVGEADTVLQLNGVGLSAADAERLYGDSEMYRYGVFKVLDPSKFLGTVTMSGHEWGAEGTDKTVGGRVQLDIMSTTKSDPGADWTNASVDLSVNVGTERTVLALDATGEVDPDKGYEWCVLNSITGSINTATGTTSVLNISAHNEVTLVLTGSRNGDYHGVMGYGDFQVAVNYGGYAEALQGTTQHHYGAKDWGALNLIKQGAGTTQRVRRAWLNEVIIEGGDFHVEEALVAGTLTTGGGKRIMVGDLDASSLYALTVGAGGVLAMNTEFNVSGTKQDAWAGISAGTTEGDSTREAGWVLLENGATLSAREDWYTRKQVDFETNASVTINTHNFTIDPYILSEDCDDDKFLKQREISHIIQLLGTVTGRNVTLTLNNWKTDPTNQDDADMEMNAVNYPDTYTVSRDVGYVALNDLNDFTGTSQVKIEDMTVLQILNNNGGVKSAVSIAVEGKNATMQIVDQVTSYEKSDSPVRSNTMVQYIHNLKLGADVFDYNAELDDAASSDPYLRQNNGQLVLGGMEQTTLKDSNNERLTAPDLAGMQVQITSRHAGANQDRQNLVGEVNRLNVDMTGTAVRMGGESNQRAELINTHVDMENMQVAHTVHNTDIVNSLVHLRENCMVNLADSVLVDYQSSVHGFSVDASVLTPDDPMVQRDAGGNLVGGGPKLADSLISKARVTEVNTSVATTVQMTFADFKDGNPQNNVYTAGSARILVLLADQFQGVDVGGNGLTIQLHEDNWTSLVERTNADFIAIQMGGGSGAFYYEVDNRSSFAQMLDSQFVLRDAQGNQKSGMWVTSTDVSQAAGTEVSQYMLYFQVQVPEPCTTTLSLAALAALCARRRRRG